MTGSASALLTVTGLSRLAARQANAVTRTQLADLGVSRFHVASQLSARRWQLVAPEILVLHTGPLAPDTLLWAAVLAAAQPVAIGSWTGLALHGLHGWDRPGAHLVVRRGSRPPRLAGVVIHESRRPAPEDIEQRRGLPVHRVERCAIDAAAWQTSPRTAVGLLAAVVQQRLTTPERLWEQLDRVGKVRFHRLMRSSIADIRGGRTPAAAGGSSTPSGRCLVVGGSSSRSTVSGTWRRRAGTTTCCETPSSDRARTP